MWKGKAWVYTCVQVHAHVGVSPPAGVFVHLRECELLRPQESHEKCPQTGPVGDALGVADGLATEQELWRSGLWFKDGAGAPQKNHGWYLKGLGEAM